MYLVVAFELDPNLPTLGSHPKKFEIGADVFGDNCLCGGIAKPMQEWPVTAVIAGGFWLMVRVLLVCSP